MTDAGTNLRFSQRLAIEVLFEHHCRKNREASCVANFLSYAQDRGWLNIEKINKSMPPEKATKILARK